MERKNIPLALILAALLGPIGTLYANITAGIMLILAAIGTALAAPTLGVAFAPLFWVAAIVVAGVTASGHNRRIKAREGEQQAAQSAEAQHQDNEWQTLLEYDTDARAAADKLKPHGQGALDELRRVYRVVKDPAKLPAAADKILQDIDAEKRRLGSLGKYLVPEQQARQRLAERGIDNPNAPGGWGNRPLHVAAKAGDVELTGLLLSAGANVLETNMAGHTPAALADKAGNTQVAELIAIYRDQIAA